MKRLNLLSKFGVIALVFALFVYACGGTQNSETEEPVADENTEPLTANKLAEYPIPTPFEVTKMLVDAKASYISDILNSNQNVYKYETEKKQALNLGVYGADLSYSSTYNKTQETMQYITASQELTEKLGIAAVLDQGVVDKLGEYQDNQDSLYSIITKTFYKSFEELNNTNRGNISALVLAGGWIEGLYISTQLALTAGKKDAVLKGISDQKNTIRTLIATLKTYEADENVKDVLTKLERINVELPETGAKFEKPQLEKLTKLVEEVRTSIIE